MTIRLLDDNVVPELANECLRGIWAAVEDKTSDSSDLATRETIGAAVFGTALQLQVWAHIQRNLTHGMETQSLLGTLRDCLETMDGTIVTVNAVLVRVKRKSKAAELWREYLTSLSEQLDQVTKARSDADRLLNAAKRPRPPIDLSRMDSEPGKPVSLDEILADL